MTKFHCDRCGKRCRTYEVGVTDDDPYLPEMVYDLCVPCLGFLREFLRGENAPAREARVAVPRGVASAARRINERTSPEVDGNDAAVLAGFVAELEQKD